jgi:ABC-2 type transport system permease protein
MRAYWTLVKREMGSFFFSWTGYVVMAAVLLLLGFSFANLIIVLNNQPTDQPVTEVFYRTMYFWLILLLATPVITMRSFAQEKASGTFETLMTTPVSDVQVVLAKFTGSLLFYMAAWLPLVVCLLILRHYSNEPGGLDLGALGATYLGIFLLGALYVSIGCFASALTRSHIIAAMVSFALGISLFLLSFLSLAFSSQGGWRARLLTHLGLIDHMKDFAAGVVDTRPIVLYSSLTLFFLFVTWKVIESRRWK